MSKDQRRPYEEKALMEKNNLKGVKLTSEGLDVEELEREQKFEQQKIQAMKEEIGCILSLAAKSESKQLLLIVFYNY